jgi:hypothetical protein
MYEWPSDQMTMKMYGGATSSRLTVWLKPRVAVSVGKKFWNLFREC